MKMRKKLVIIVCFFCCLFLNLSVQADTNKVIINEIMPDPEGKDSEKEWVELYNPNDFEVDLIGWQIKDKIGRTRTFLFNDRTFDRTKIEPFSFVICPIDKTKISLNNTGDIVELLSPQGQVVDRVEYPKAQPGQSYSRFAENWQWAQPSPGQKNILKIESPINVAEKSPIPAATTQLIPKTGRITLTNINQATGPKTNNVIWFIIAFLVAGLSTVVAVFFAKKKV